MAKTKIKFWSPPLCYFHFFSSSKEEKETCTVFNLLALGRTVHIFASTYSFKPTLLLLYYLLRNSNGKSSSKRDDRMYHIHFSTGADKGTALKANHEQWKDGGPLTSSPRVWPSSSFLGYFPRELMKEKALWSPAFQALISASLALKPKTHRGIRTVPQTHQATLIIPSLLPLLPLLSAFPSLFFFPSF